MLAGTGLVDWNKRNIWGQTPLALALAGGHSDVVHLLVEQTDVDFSVRNNYGQTLAQLAVLAGDLNCVETLAAEEDCDCWNVPDENGDTPVMLALKEGKTDLVILLASCPRVDLTTTDGEGWSLVFRLISYRERGKYKTSHYFD